MEMDKTIVIALTSSINLANEVVTELGIPLGKSEVKHFADGEIMVELGRRLNPSAFPWEDDMGILDWYLHDGTGSFSASSEVAQQSGAAFAAHQHMGTLRKQCVDVFVGIHFK